MQQTTGRGNQTYHHGDLRAALLDAAAQRIESQGVDALSLRKLADDVGVSRSALYHHFRDKNALLNAVAARGFEQWIAVSKARANSPDMTPEERLGQFVHGYIHWSARNPQLYDLMFGRPIWKTGQADDQLKEIAYPAFQFMLNKITQWQEEGIIAQSMPALRQTQVIWATLHGLARLIIDGVYADSEHIDDMCDCTVAMLLKRN